MSKPDQRISEEPAPHQPEAVVKRTSSRRFLTNKLSSRQGVLLALGIASLLKITNFVILFTNEANSFTSSPIMDERYHHELALHLSDGPLFPTEIKVGGRTVDFIPYYRSPLYYYTLASVYKTFGTSFLAGRLLSLFCGLGIIFFVYKIAEELYNRTTGIIACVIASLAPMLLYFDFMLLSTALETLLYAGGLLALIVARKHRRSLLLSVAGFSFGLGALARPTILPFVAIVALYLLLERDFALNRRLGRAFAFGLPVALCVLSATAINGFIGGDFKVPVAWNGGINFFYGNHREATGWSALSPRTDGSWWGGYFDAIRIATQESGLERQLKKSEVASYWFAEGAEFIKSEPLAWSALMGRKLGFMISNMEISNNQSIWGFRRFSFLLMNPLFSFGSLIGLATLGIALGALRKPGAGILGGYLAAYTVVILFFFVNARYRVPLLPVFAVLGAQGIWSLFSSRWEARKGIALALAIGVAVLSFSNETGAKRTSSELGFHYSSLGYSFYLAGDYANAATALEEGDRLYPGQPALSWSLADAYYHLGRFDEALVIYERMLLERPTSALLERLEELTRRRSPSDAKADFYAALRAFREARYKDSLGLLNRIVERVPEGFADRVFYLRALSALALEDLDVAQASLERVRPGYLDRDERLRAVRQRTQRADGDD
jgi:4-amino-4-deoxy-L-arabinose transferase-like glycosyltransferase